MQMIYDIVGRILFPRRYDWERRRDARTLMLTILFSVGFSLLLATFMQIINHRR